MDLAQAVGLLKPLVPRSRKIVRSFACAQDDNANCAVNRGQQPRLQVMVSARPGGSGAEAMGNSGQAAQWAKPCS